jgi:hypothetical protein
MDNLFSEREKKKRTEKRNTTEKHKRETQEREREKHDRETQERERDHKKTIISFMIVHPLQKTEVILTLSLVRRVFKERMR